MAESAAENAMEIALGRVPPHAEIRRSVPLPDILRGSTFLGLQASCGCVEPGILASGFELKPGSLLPSTGALSLRVEFRPKAKAGKNTETVRIRYKQQGSHAESVQAFRFFCEILPSLSLLEQAGMAAVQATIEADAPIRKLERNIVLRQPVSVADLRERNRDCPEWLHFLLGDEESVDTIRMEIQGLSVVRDFEAELKIPYAEGISELVFLRVHLRADAKLVPGGVSETVRFGSKLELPVRMEDGTIGELAEDLVFRQFREVGGDKSKGALLPKVSLHIDKDPASRTQGNLILRASGFVRAGAFEGEVLVRPQGRAYQLPLPVFFRVIGVK